MNLFRYKGFWLIIILVVFIIIGVSLGKQGFKMMEEKKFEDLKTDLLLIQAKVKVIKGKSEVSSSTDLYVGTKITELQDNTVNEFLKGLGVPEEEFEKYFMLGSEDFETLQIKEDLKNASDKSYIVNYDIPEVIYIKGITANGQTKYKLSEII